MVEEREKLVVRLVLMLGVKLSDLVYCGRKNGVIKRGNVLIVFVKKMRMKVSDLNRGLYLLVF